MSPYWKQKIYLVIWQSIDYNIGSAFNSSFGVFISPYDGIYSFNARIYGDDNGSLHLLQYTTNAKEEWSNGHFSTHSFNLNSFDKHQDTINGILKLRKGDTIGIKVISEYLYDEYIYDEYNCERTYFQGHLIALLWITLISIKDKIWY